jgi:hypothetical protein
LAVASCSGVYEIGSHRGLAQLNEAGVYATA